MTIPTHIAAAAKRLKAHNDAIRTEEYSKSPYWHPKANSEGNDPWDRAKVANDEGDCVEGMIALIASEQAGEEAITIEWLMSLGLEVIPGLGFVLKENIFVINSKRGWLAQCYDRMNDEPEEPIEIVRLKTKGDVIRLAAALSIDLKPRDRRGN